VPRRRERPVAAGEPLAPAIAERELPDVGDGQSRGTEPEREPRVATQPRRLGCVPGAAVVEVRRQADAEQAPHLVLHHEPVLESACKRTCFTSIPAPTAPNCERGKGAATATSSRRQPAPNQSRA